VLTSKVNVLDKGFVQLIRVSCDVHEDEAGEFSYTPCTDLFVVNDAKVSTAKESESWGKGEERLIGFLGREDHTSPFRGAVMTFRIKAPLFVARQIFKYAIGTDHDESMVRRDQFASWNEESRRYVDSEPEFYVPKIQKWRKAPDTRRQGSSNECLEVLDGDLQTTRLSWHTNDGLELYNEALEAGVAPELARLYLPAYAMYTSWVMTTSLQGLCHILEQRLPHDAQSETRQYAEALKTIGESLYPHAIKAYLKEK
jgi:thymidylate synthase (FAD)